MIAERTAWTRHAARGVAAWARGLVLPLLLSSVASAQTPVFQLQPGIAISDFVSVPEGTASTTAFSLRFQTRFPTSSRWFTPVIGALVLPYGSTGTINRKTDAPTLYAGNIFRVLTPARTGGWVSVDLPLLLAHAPRSGLHTYGRDLVILPTINLHIGSRGLSELGKAWSRLEVFAQIEQNLTPNADPETGQRDRLRPVATFGASFAFGSVPPNE